MSYQSEVLMAAGAGGAAGARRAVADTGAGVGLAFLSPPIESIAAYHALGEISATAFSSFAETRIRLTAFSTRGDGNCGYYALPVADRGSARDKLLAVHEDAE